MLDAEGDYQRLGDTAVRRSRFRLVAATNRDPAQLKHDFLARFTRRIQVPGLGERVGDIPLLVHEILWQQARAAPATVGRFFQQGMPRVDPTLLEMLLRRRYTHHMRELRHLLIMSATTSPDDYLAATPEVLAALRTEEPDEEDTAEAGSGSGAELPPDQVVVALRDAEGNVTRAAASLGVSRFALMRFMRRHGLGAKA